MVCTIFGFFNKPLPSKKSAKLSQPKILVSRQILQNPSTCIFVHVCVLAVMFCYFLLGRFTGTTHRSGVQQQKLYSANTGLMIIAAVLGIYLAKTR